MLPNIDGHGRNTYVYERGDLRRFQTGAERTLIPNDGETNQQFARRAEQHVLAAFANPDLHKITLVEQITNYAITGYTLVEQRVQRLAPIVADGRVASAGRHGVARGVRGGDRHRVVLN